MNYDEYLEAVKQNGFALSCVPEELKTPVDSPLTNEDMER